MEIYINVDVKIYVEDCLIKGAEVIQAEKFARVKARKGIEGETIISWAQDSNGNEIVEKVTVVQEDEFVLTKVDELGNEIIDKNGHTNEWVVKKEVLEKKYDIDYGDILKPKGGIQLFIQVPNNIILKQWGGEYKISKGGYINITNENDMYGISNKDFNDTYKIVKETKRSL